VKLEFRKSRAFVHAGLRSLENSVATRSLPLQTPRTASDVLEDEVSIAVSPLPIVRDLAMQAATFRAATRWVPSESDIQRGRIAMLDVFRLPQNLRLKKFAALSGRSRQQICNDIGARRLLTLDVGRRGCKLPAWQLDRRKQQLTEAVLRSARGVDNWTIYGVLSLPLEVFEEQSPLDALQKESVETVVRAVLNVLGIIDGY